MANRRSWNIRSRPDLPHRRSPWCQGHDRRCDSITDAKAHGNLWRGFENFLLGRDANDAITFVQRICGVCPVPHGMTSTYAVDTVLGYSAGHITFADDGANGVPHEGGHIRNLVLGMEFLMSSITHFYHLAAPSYVQGPAIPPWTPYFADSYYSHRSALTVGHAVRRSRGSARSALTASRTTCGPPSSAATSWRCASVASPSRRARCSPVVCR